MGLLDEGSKPGFWLKASLSKDSGSSRTRYRCQTNPGRGVDRDRGQKRRGIGELDLKLGCVTLNVTPYQLEPLLPCLKSGTASIQLVSTLE